MTKILINKEGKVEDVKSRKPIEVLSDPDHPLVRNWMELHGPGKAGYNPWCKEGDYSKRTPDSDFSVFGGGWDKPPTYAEYNGSEECSTLTNDFTVEGHVLCLALKTENLGMALKCKTWQGFVRS